MLRRRSVLRAALAGLGGLSLLTAVGGRLVADRTTVPSVLVAGSLQGVASTVGGASVEAHGSVAARRLVLEEARSPDAMALADPALFEGIATTATRFATNALVIAYHPSSRFADPLERDWVHAIGRPGIDLGRTDPEQDPLGYRTVMALRLGAERGLDPGEVLEASSVLPETALMRTLEAGELDGAFAYRSMAVEHDLPYVDLPAGMDFSDPSEAERYATVSVELRERTVRGAPIVYAAAALTDDGRPWVEALTRAHDVLRSAGFTVPAGYPSEGPIG